MQKAYLPLEHHYRLINEHIPEMRWDRKEDFSAWQKRAKEKLYDLLGLAEIEKYRVPLEVEIEFDRYAEDLDAREIRFIFASEKGVNGTCHLFIPKGYEGKKLPLMATVMGHGRGMHISQGRVKYPEDPATFARNPDAAYVPPALERGLAAFTLEQRGFGENGGHTTAGTPRCTEVAKRAIMMGRTLIGERVWDIMRCLDAIEKCFSDLVDLDKIMLMGNSGGGTATTYASIMDDRIKIGMPSCAVCDWAESIALMSHCMCNYIPSIARYFDMGDLLALAAPKRMVVVSGAIDEGFLLDGAKNSVAIGRRGYEALGASDNLVHVIGGAGHRFYSKDAYPYVLKFIDEL